ncbi:hypothetical protein BKA66DRAFT_149821 [Pyrenochaeta sp. MPI-SDFR-AT-0127]|nr:hypothetical protein BKA66DRAFT_149821 [Pyrenochaeta sp. MPI-SDFR-AT-0127]
MPYQNSISHESQGHSRPVEQGNDVRPSDQELLRQVARDVVFRPTVQSTPPEFRPLGVPPHRVFRGSPRHGRAERLDPSFQVRFPGYQYYRTGVVFRVLWPELAGDVKQNITIATTQYGENIFYKIRWFVVVREGHNCCTCLSIQTYGGRGVPPGKPKEHHAIMYTGDTEPEASPSEMVHGEPPMGRSIRVISKQPWMKLDKMSRVNFVKIYTVEHNVKVEDFGRVDPEDEWKLMTQFNLHWGIPGREALPPATRSSYYDGTTYGPAPSTIAPQNQVYSAATQGPTPYTSNIPAMNGDTTSSRDAQHQYQVPPTEQYISSTHTSSSYVPVIDDTHYDTDDRPTYHHRSDSHKSNQSHGSHGQRRRY